MAKEKSKIKEMKDEDLKKLMDEKQEELHKSQFGLAGAKNKNVHYARNLRKDIARIKTLLQARKNQ